jgi:hypothetical protein
MRSRKFLPALDEQGKAVEGLAKGQREHVQAWFEEGGSRHPQAAADGRRRPAPGAHDVRGLRLGSEPHADRSRASGSERREMPYISAHLYSQGKDMSGEVAEKFWDTWPKTLDKVIERCEKAPEKMYLHRSADTRARRNPADAGDGDGLRAIDFTASQDQGRVIVVPAAAQPLPVFFAACHAAVPSA